MALSANDVLEEARAQLQRVNPNEAASLVRGGALLVDIRPQHQRAREGEIPGSLFIERNVLEWRFDLTDEFHIPEVTSYDQKVVITCSEGYTSSLAAFALQRLGFVNATDIEGGFQAWKTADLPTQPGGTDPLP